MESYNSKRNQNKSSTSGDVSSIKLKDMDDDSLLFFLRNDPLTRRAMDFVGWDDEKILSVFRKIVESRGVEAKLMTCIDVKEIDENSNFSDLSKKITKLYECLMEEVKKLPTNRNEPIFCYIDQARHELDKRYQEACVACEECEEFNKKKGDIPLGLSDKKEREMINKLKTQYLGDAREITEEDMLGNIGERKVREKIITLMKKINFFQKGLSVFNELRNKAEYVLYSSWETEQTNNILNCTKNGDKNINNMFNRLQVDKTGSSIGCIVKFHKIDAKKVKQDSSRNKVVIVIGEKKNKQGNTEYSCLTINSGRNKYTIGEFENNELNTSKIEASNDAKRCIEDMTCSSINTESSFSNEKECSFVSGDVLTLEEGDYEKREFKSRITPELLDKLCGFIKNKGLKGKANSEVAEVIKTLEEVKNSPQAGYTNNDVINKVKDEIEALKVFNMLSRNSKEGIICDILDKMGIDYKEIEKFSPKEARVLQDMLHELNIGDDKIRKMFSKEAFEANDEKTKDVKKEADKKKPEINDSGVSLLMRGMKKAKKEEEAKKAEASAKALFGGAGDSQNMPCTEISDADLVDGVMDIMTALVKTGLCASKSDARRNIQQGGVNADDVKITDIAKVFTADELKCGVVLKRGKKNFNKIILK